MAQISRPFQIALVAVVAARRRLAFRPARALRHRPPRNRPRRPHGPPPQPPRRQRQPPPRRPSTTAPPPASHGLSADVAKAHGAVATSQQNAKQLEQKSAQASSATPHARRLDAARADPGAHPRPAPKHAAVIVHKQQSAPRRGQASSTALVHQQPVEGQLQGRRRGGRCCSGTATAPTTSPCTAPSCRCAGTASARSPCTVATPGEVASFGTITRGVQVYGTPDRARHRQGAPGDGHHRLHQRLRDPAGDRRSASRLALSPLHSLG